MLRQQEQVPTRFVVGEASNSVKVSSASISLQSASDARGEPSQFTFEAIRPNLFRTTFTSAKHHLPPFPSVHRPEADSTVSSFKVEKAADQSLCKINTGAATATVEWSHAPKVSLYLDGATEPIHQDLTFRSYALDSTGIAHYTAWNKGTLHVGLGEKAAPMDLSGRGFNITASDTFGYDAYKTDPLYKHVPLLINVTPKGCVGIFSSSHSRATWCIGSEIDGMWGRFKVYRQAHGGLEEYLILGKTVADVVRSYAQLAGFPLLVPRYMMGYISGGMKYSMEDEPRAHDCIMNFIAKCKANGMPTSAFQMSSGYTVSEVEPKTRNVMTWNYHRFPDPREFTRAAHKEGVHLLANVKPYVLSNHPGYDSLNESGGFFKDPATGKTAVARLWSAGGGESGVGSHIDFTSKAGYDWWYKGVKDLKEVGIDAMWNDNNEYNIPSDDWQCALTTVPVPEGEDRDDIGLWGRAIHTELMGKSSHDATLESEPGRRPLVLTRSATTGTMRYCASSWSGDNVTSWEDMKGANALALNAGFSLLQCYGHDIGGFEGPQPTPEHLVRWIQLGVHSPRFTINCYKTSPEDNLVGDVIEPFQYPSTTPIIRKAVRRRYELVPYTYSQALLSHRDATPPQRWTGWGYENDPEVWTKKIYQGDTQFWFGDALMISGVYEPGDSTARVYLPDNGGDPGYLNTNAPYQYLKAGAWHNISSTWHTSIPIIARIGSAIPVGKPEPTETVAETDPEFPNVVKDDWRGIEIFPPPLIEVPDLPDGFGRLTLDPKNESREYTSTWLEDDGFSTAEKSDVFETTIAYKASPDTITVRLETKKAGAFEPLWLKNGVDVILPVGEHRTVKVEGKAGGVEQLKADEKERSVWRITGFA